MLREFPQVLVRQHGSYNNLHMPCGAPAFVAKLNKTIIIIIMKIGQTARIKFTRHPGRGDARMTNDLSFVLIFMCVFSGSSRRQDRYVEIS